VALLLGAGAVAWVVVEIAFALHGWPAVPRYLFQAVAVVCVLAGVLVGRVIADVPRAVARAGRAPAWLGGAAAAVIIGALVLSLAPAAQSRWNIEKRDLRHERARTAEFNRLRGLVDFLGGARMQRCAKINIPIEYQSVLAWYLGIKIGVLYVNPATLARGDQPLLNIYPVHDGWKVFPSHIPPADASRCNGLVLVTHA